MGLQRFYGFTGHGGHLILVLRSHKGLVYEMWAKNGTSFVAGWYVPDGPLITQLKREGVRL